MIELIQCLVHRLEIHRLLHHLTKIRKTREYLIVFSTAIVLLLPTPLWVSSLPYYEYYFFGIVKTAFMLIFISYITCKTYSLRLLGLAMLLLIDATFDFASLFSTSLYWIMKPYRYEGVMNYYNLFIMYELLTIFWSDIDRHVRNYLDKSTQNTIDIRITDCQCFIGAYMAFIFKKSQLFRT